MVVDLWFSILVGQSLPSDHGYGLYGAICRVLPKMHESDWWGLHTVRGARSGEGLIVLPKQSWLGIRIVADQIVSVLPLAGRQLEVDGHHIGLGSPTIQALAPSPALSARMVTIKDSTELEPFETSVRRQLAELSITNETVEVGSRKIVTIDGYKIVGFSLRVTGLSPGHSIKLQEEGIGGRRRMGCGIFRRSVRMLAPDRRPIG
jgi:CRISPR-associated protein Cas6